MLLWWATNYCPVTSLLLLHHLHTLPIAALSCCCVAQAVRKMMDAKKLESTLNYDSSFGDGNQKG